MKVLLILLVACILVFGACGPSEDEMNQLRQDFSKAKKENDDIKAKHKEATTRLKAVEKELDDLKNGPGRILAEAKTFFEEKKYKECSNTCFKVVDKYPGSVEAIEASKLYEETRLIRQKLGEK